MSVLYMMVGVPGSGKSTVANEMGKVLGIPVISSDLVRKEVTGSEEDFSQDYYVWTSVIPKKLKDSLSKGDAIFDATNLKARDRKKILNLAGPTVEKLAIVVDTPIETCIERQNLRERKVPSDRIREMYCSFALPTTEEGFSAIYTGKTAEEILRQMEKEEIERV